MDFDPDAYLKSKQSQPQGFDPDAYLKSKGAPGEPGLLRKGLDYGLRGLDYAGGVGRFAAAGLANIPYSIATGKSLTKPEDLGAVLRGQGPSTSDYMERGGVPAGPSVDLNPWMEGKTSLRDAAGFVGDVATDPLTYLGLPGGSKAAEVANKGLHLTESAADSAGKGIYKSGFKKIDERLAEQGKKPLSDVLLESGAPTGTTKTIAEKSKQITKDALAERKGLYDQIGDRGVKVDLEGHPLARTDDLLKDIRSTPGLGDKAAKLEDIVNDFKNRGKVDVATLSKWKSRLYDALPDSAFGPNGQPRGAYGELYKALSSDLKDLIVEAGNKAGDNLGSKVGKTNQTMSTMLSAKKPMMIQIRRGETPNLITSVDAILGGTGHGAALPLKKAADLSKTTWARTKLGKGLMNASESGLLDPAARRAVIDYMSEKKKK